MRDDLLDYYERELIFLRQMGAEFAQKYPKIASRLLLEPTQCDDPHVERMLEAFAFLAGRVHLKIDDEFPEITDALLSVLYPHFVRPVPSMSIAEFHADPEQGGLSTGLPVPRGTVLYSKPVDGFPCKFQTCYDTVLWPIAVADAQWKTPDRLQPALKYPGAAACLRIELRCPPDIKFNLLEIPKLRIYLNGESNLISHLYELLNCNCLQILIRDVNPESRKKPVSLPPEALRPVGFAEDEGLMPGGRRSFIGYRLLQEYFSFPEKFFFLDITQLERLASSQFEQGIEILFLISQFERPDRQQMLEQGVMQRTIRLGCSPIVNLFGQTAEPILLTQMKPEYDVIPDVRRRTAMEVFSIDEVLSSDPQTGDTVAYDPFYSFRHSRARDRKQTFWHAKRRASTRPNDAGTEVSLSLVDLSGRTSRPELDTITVRCTCTNRDLPFRLPFGNEASGDFEPEGLTPVRRVVALRKPTPAVRPPLGKGALWRLISHLSLNYLSLVDDGKDALQEILRLYEFTGSGFLEKQIAGIVGLSSKRHFARVISENGVAFVRGTRCEIEFDEEQFAGGGVYLFASVLEHFLGLYVSINSFSQLVARTRQRRENLREWPPRAGQKILV
ncbi:MAG TPA: type VI secretion system baseplate subunit TssF [Bryobacteraceae bacterium]|nr:type VI secretion system baseplate subunit TssF [Bryobacteraceae bacterium]